MSVTRPTGYPQWADGATAVVTTPTANQLSNGWSGGQKPPAGYMNWWQHLTYDWVRWFDYKATSFDGNVTTFDNELRYEYVLSDDFVRGNASTSDADSTPTGIGPVWAVSATGVNLNNVNLNGLVALTVASGQSSYLMSRVGAMQNQDFKLESIMSVQGRGRSGSAIEVGWLDHAYLLATGASSNWFLMIARSGASQGYSGLDLGVDPLDTAFKRFTLERRGATLTASIGTSAGSSAIASVGNASVISDEFISRQVGVRVKCFDNAAQVVVYFDKIRLGLKRNI